MAVVGVVAPCCVVVAVVALHHRVWRRGRSTACGAAGVPLHVVSRAFHRVWCRGRFHRVWRRGRPTACDIAVTVGAPRGVVAVVAVVAIVAIGGSVGKEGGEGAR